MRTTEGIEISAGYVVSARVAVGFDGGNHDICGDLLSCRRCGSHVRPADQEIHDGHHERLDLFARFMGMPPEAAEAPDMPPGDRSLT